MPCWRKAMRICGAKFGRLFRSKASVRASRWAISAGTGRAVQRACRPARGAPARQSCACGPTSVQIADTLADRNTRETGDDSRAHPPCSSYPCSMTIELVGAIAIYRQEFVPFTDKQIELVQNFAAQAVIAIENTRLLSELRKSLQQQTATADVLKVISSSPGELEPVFGALLENATRICEARFGNMSLYNGETFQNVALHNPPDGYSREALAR